ncbi:MAG TPA: thiamine phosphate synthase [Stellaceae bacterium]|nr:thiamine phosphate synthase [Stellaceae bacterium]
MSLLLQLPIPAVLAITDRHQAKPPLEDIAAALFAGGCRWLSLREKDMPAAERRALLQRLVALGKKCGATITVHDDLEAAAALDIGIHLPAQGSVAEARRVLGPKVLIGISAHGAAEVAKAAAAGADYATLSPIFLTQSKPGYGPALGLDALRGPWQLPVLALGGVDTGNAAACLEAGATGIAVMGEAMRAADPKDFMAGLLAHLPGRLVASSTCPHSS